jgi:hypothetical protein
MIEWLVVTQFLTILIMIMVMAFLAIRMIMAPGVGSGTSGDERSSSDPFGSFYVVALGITAVVFGFLAILLFADRFRDLTSALGFLTALFGAITGLVGTYFGIKTSSDAREGAQQLARSSAGDTPPPEVTSTSPVDRAVDVALDIRPTATFSKDMDSATINLDTFKLLDETELDQLEQVAGGVVYDATTRKATFTPTNPLRNGRTYAATITAGVKDRAGTTLAQDYTWRFRVTRASE